MLWFWQTKSKQNMGRWTTILNHLSKIRDIIANASTFTVYIFSCPLPKQKRLLPFSFYIMGWTSFHPGYLSKLRISWRSWNHPDDNMISQWNLHEQIPPKKSTPKNPIEVHQLFSPVAQWTYRCGWGGWVEIRCHRIFRWIFSAESRQRWMK